MRINKPEIDTALASQLALEHFGMQVVAEALPGEIDRNFLLADVSGPLGVLKVVPSQLDRSILECQVAALEHLQGSCVRELIPQVRKSVHGQALLPVQDLAGLECTLRLVSYLHGTPLASWDPNAVPVSYEDIGVRLAQLDVGLEDFDHQGAHRKFHWDLKRLLELQPLLPQVTAERRALVHAGLERFAERVQPYLVELPHGVIHNDANDHNLLFDNEPDASPGGDERGVACLTGIIDFGDIVYSATVCELAIACAYSMLDAPEPRRVAAQIRRGYERQRPLKEIEATVLPDLIIGRLCCSVLLSAEARSRAPEDDYLTISEAPAFTLLERLLHE